MTKGTEKPEPTPTPTRTLALAFVLVILALATIWCGYHKFIEDGAPSRETNLGAVQNYGVGVLLFGTTFVVMVLLFAGDHYRYWDGHFKKIRARHNLVEASKLQRMPTSASRPAVRPPPRRPTAS